MNRRTAPRVLAPLVVLAGLAGLATGCSGDADKPEATTTTAEVTTTAGGSQVVAPIMVDLASAGGTTVTVPLGNVVILNSETPTAWTATIADPSIASFTAGGSDGSATFNPGLTPLGAGTTEVTVTDGTSTVTFTLTVTA
ncbi:MAG: hypothetical protein ACKOD2_03760 [Ilumatobacteraceae bacterium]